MVSILEFLKKPIFLSVLVCIFYFYSGLFNFSPEKKIVSLISENNISEISGYIVSSPVKSSSGKTYSCLFKLQNVKDSNMISSTAAGIIKILIPADSVEAFFPGKLYSKALKGTFFYEAGGFYKFTGKYSNSFFLVNKCLNNAWKKNLFGIIDYFRALCRLQFKRLMYSWGNGGGLLLALLCGAKEYTETNISEYFRNAGLSHILALSGMHLSMFSAVSVFIGNKLKSKKSSYILRFLVLTLFVWFAGFSPSLLRAYICSLLLLFASIINIDKPDIKIILCFSFLIQCIISPTDINNAGFILSYGALGGILIFSNFFSSIFIKIIPKSFGDSFSASLSAQAFTVPISLKFFGCFSPIGIIATTVISPLITIFIYSGLFLILVSLLIPPIAAYSGIFVNFQYNIIKYLVFNFAKAPRITI